jgi:hypothetical protein
MLVMTHARIPAVRASIPVMIAIARRPVMAPEHTPGEVIQPARRA